MRRFLAFFLAALMVLSLCGCGATQAQADALLSSLRQAQATLDRYAALQSDGTEDVVHVRSAQDFYWNEQMTVWFVLPIDAAPDEIVTADTMAAICQTCGWRYEQQQLDGKTVTPSSLLTQAAQSGTVGAIVFTQLQAYTAPLVQAAADAGIIVLCIDGDSAVPDAGSIAIDRAALAQETYDLIRTWTKAQSRSREQHAVAVNTCGMAEGDAPWSEALNQLLTESDTLYNLYLFYSSTGDSTFNESYLWAKQVLEAAPETRIFCCAAPEAAYGVCRYLEQYAADWSLSLSDFCVVWLGQDEDSDTYLAAARESSDYTAARGYVVAQDSPLLTGSRLAQQLLGIAYGDELPISLSDAFAVLSENGLSVPDTFGGWQWGLDAAVGITVYASFAEDDGYIFVYDDMPLADIMQAAAGDQA